MKSKLLSPVRFVEFSVPKIDRLGSFTLLCWIFVTSTITSWGMGSAVESTNGTAVLKGLSLEELMNIEVISVSRHPEKLSDTASAIQVVTADDISRSGVTSIPEALRMADNLQVAQKGSHSWGISARGFNTDLANKLLVLIDGRTVYTPLYSGVFWDRQNYLMADIDRIEVVSGPGGALWGANAVNGVINIISKSAQDTQGGYFDMGAGTELRSSLSARYGGHLGPNIYYRVYGNYFDRDGGSFSDGSDAGDSWQMGQGGFRIDALTSPDNTFTLQGDLYTNSESVLTGGKSKTIGGNILSRWTHELDADSSMTLQVYYDSTYLNSPSPALVINNNQFAPAGTFKDGLGTYDVDFQHNFALGERNHIVWGLGYRLTRDKVQNAPALAFYPADLDQQLFSGFVQDEITLIPEKLSVTLGTKVEHNDYTEWELEPSARLQWNVSGSNLIWTAVSRAVRTPSRIDRDLSQPAVPNIVVLAGDSGFNSESVTAYELGYRTQVAPSLAVSTAFFFNQYDDIRSTSYTPTVILPLYFANNLEGETYGAEISLNYQVNDWWRLKAAYNYLHENINVKAGQSDLNNALNETADPQQRFSLRSSMDLPAKMSFDAAFRWVDTLHNNSGANTGTVPAYAELDLHLGWNPWEWIKLSLVGRNLLHDHHPEYGYPDASRVELDRSIYGSVSLYW